jgi:hypothetical protein
MAKLAEKRRFGSFDSQTRYSNSAIWQRAPESFKPSPHKAILLVLAAGIGDLFPAFPTAATFSWETLRDRWRNWAGRYSRRRPNRRRDVEIRLRAALNGAQMEHKATKDNQGSKRRGIQIRR